MSEKGPPRIAPDLHKRIKDSIKEIRTMPTMPKEFTDEIDRRNQNGIHPEWLIAPTKAPEEPKEPPLSKYVKASEAQTLLGFGTMRKVHEAAKGGFLKRYKNPNDGKPVFSREEVMKLREELDKKRAELQAEQKMPEPPVTPEIDPLHDVKEYVELKAEERFHTAMKDALTPITTQLAQIEDEALELAERVSNLRKRLEEQGY